MVGAEFDSRFREKLCLNEKFFVHRVVLSRWGE
jgi:hypothetical protein